MAKKKTAESESLTLSKAIRMAVDSGQVEFGSRSSFKRALLGKSKLIVLSSNCPEFTKNDIQKFCKLSSIPILEFEGTSIELGSVCGKPFPVSSLCIQDAGNSTILSFAKKEQ
ncbi:50S ribosomal protein L30e [Candidatus Micrarchaeota archaeon]|nr:50S ribosomal protein L30e [Candidatus Micrarchaeota archaeon]